MDLRFAEEIAVQSNSEASAPRHDDDGQPRSIYQPHTHIHVIRAGSINVCAKILAIIRNSANQSTFHFDLRSIFV